MLSRVNRIYTALNAGAIRLKQFLIVPSAESHSPPSLCVNAANSGPTISTVLRVAQRVVEADRNRQVYPQIVERAPDLEKVHRHAAALD